MISTNDLNNKGRRKFLKQSGLLISTALLSPGLTGEILAGVKRKKKTLVNAHLWVYASKFPPDWDVTPNLETVFADLSYAGIEGVELMESTLRHDDSVSRINGLVKKYKLPVAGTSYGSYSMWDVDQHKKILDDINLVIPRLQQVNGKRLGISVGDAKRLKTEKELDAQADVLKQIMLVCSNHGIEPNLHNHTYEVVNDMHDLKGTLARIPNIALGPDLNWLIRGGVNPVDFINTYGKQITYLHIRDQYADGTWTEYVGEGVTDFDAIAKALKAQQFTGDVAIELAFPANFTPVNPLKEDWKKSRQFVKKAFGW